MKAWEWLWIAFVVTAVAWMVLDVRAHWRDVECRAMLRGPAVAVPAGR